MTIPHPLGLALARGGAAAILVFLCVWAPAPARAERVRGTVVRVADGEIYVDLGRGARVEVGRPARVWRRVVLRHPVTGKAVADEIPLGALTIVSVGDRLTLAEPVGAPAYAIAVGDVVEVLVESPEPPAAPPPPRAPEPERPAIPEEPLPEADAATRLVVDTWRGTVGKSLEARIATWEHFLGKHPDSPHAPAIRAELAALVALRDELTGGVGAAPEDAALAGLEHEGPRAWPYREALGLVFVRTDERIVGAWLHHRRAGEATYHKLALERDGDAYLRATIPAGDVVAPGVEYFVEVLTADREVGTAVGSPSAPRVVAVAAPDTSTLFVERRHRSRVSLTTAYVDYGNFDARPGNTEDRMSVFEADFFYRLRTRLYGVRVGLGVLDGVGGRAEPLPMGVAPAKAALTYGYTEVELRSKGQTAVMLRAIAGSGLDGLGFGAEARLRLGPEDGTNLVFAASTLAGVGSVSELELTWMAIPTVPLGLSIAVGDQPTGGDLGVRFAADVGLRALPWLTPTLQISYQGRSLEHSGMGAGLGLVFDW